MTHAIVHPSRRLVALFVAAVAAVTMLAAAGSAQANWHYTKSGAQKLARDYVSRHYANTRYRDVTAACRPQGGHYDSRFKYHRWVCGWYDSSDNSVGTVLIVGSDTGSSSYYGKVLRGARHYS